MFDHVTVEHREFLSIESTNGIDQSSLDDHLPGLLAITASSMGNR